MRERLDLKRLLSVFLFSFALILSACGSDEPEKEAPKAETEKPKVEKEVETPQTLEEVVKENIEKEIGDEAKKSDGKERVVEVKTIDDAVAGEGFKIVNVELNADQHNTTARTRDVMLLDSAKLFPKIFEDENVSEVSLNWNVPLVDDKGNDEQVTVITITLRVENAQDINWEKFDVYKFESVADRYYEHKLFQQ